MAEEAVGEEREKNDGEHGAGDAAQSFEHEQEQDAAEHDAVQRARRDGIGKRAIVQAT